MPIQPDRLWDIAQDVLGAVVDGYDAAGVVLPARRYVASGLPAYDCDLCAVWVEAAGSHQGEPGSEAPSAIYAHPGSQLRYATLNVTVLRCVPTVEADDATGDYSIPSVAEEEAAARLVLADAVLVWRSISERAGLIASCNTISPAGWVSDPPDGGLAGGTQKLHVGLE